MSSHWWRALALGAITATLITPVIQGSHGKSRRHKAVSRSYLGFDSNNYPGDAALPALRRTFSFSGYWLNQPPGGASVPWSGKRALLLRDGFGFLVLFNGRLERDLKNPKRAAQLGSSDAAPAVDAAIREGFHPGAIIFLDQEEGGEMEPDQLAYLLAWIDGVRAGNFRAGIYCSGIPASAGSDGMMITANDIRRRAGNRDISFFVYNDVCPPRPVAPFRILRQRHRKAECRSPRSGNSRNRRNAGNTRPLAVLLTITTGTALLLVLRSHQP